MSDLSAAYAKACVRLGDLEAKKRKLEAAIEAVHQEIAALDLAAGIAKPAKQEPPSAK